jgi:hypothetical protein
MSSADVFTYDVDPLLPGPPTNPTAVVTSCSSATVTFDAPVANGTDPIISYTATAPDNSTWPQANPAILSIVANGLSGGLYTFTVFATNDKGNGLPSVESNSVTITGACG